jgi:hypothetical protein
MMTDGPGRGDSNDAVYMFLLEDGRLASNVTHSFTKKHPGYSTMGLPMKLEHAPLGSSHTSGKALGSLAPCWWRMHQRLNMLLQEHAGELPDVAPKE